MRTCSLLIGSPSAGFLPRIAHRIKLPTSAWTSVAPLRELGREGPRQRHRGHRLFGPRVGDRLANPVLRYSQRLHQLNLTALVLGRLKLRLPAAPFLTHFTSRYVAKIKISVALNTLSIGLQSPGAYAIRHFGMPREMRRIAEKRLTRVSMLLSRHERSC